MEYLIGLILSLAVAGLATVVGFDRERAFYPTVMIVIASYYVLFAAMEASRRTLAIEILVAGGFLLVAVFGYRRNFWLVVAALIGHGIFDFVHHFVIDNPGAHWWPGFCLAFDALLAKSNPVLQGVTMPAAEVHTFAKTAACSICHVPQQSTVRRLQAVRGALGWQCRRSLRLNDQKKERGFSAPLLERKKLDTKRESTIFISASFVPSLLVAHRKVYSVRCEADVMTSVINTAYRESWHFFHLDCPTINYAVPLAAWDAATRRKFRA